MENLLPWIPVALHLGTVTKQPFQPLRAVAARKHNLSRDQRGADLPNWHGYFVTSPQPCDTFTRPPVSCVDHSLFSRQRPRAFPRRSENFAP
jgi:hypothetical protein